MIPVIVGLVAGAAATLITKKEEPKSEQELIDALQQSEDQNDTLVKMHEEALNDIIKADEEKAALLEEQGKLQEANKALSEVNLALTNQVKEYEELINSDSPGDAIEHHEVEENDEIETKEEAA